MRMDNINIKQCITFTIVFVTLFTVSGTSAAKEKIIVFHAGSLAVPFMKIEKEFEKEYLQYNVVREAAGSRECARKITDTGKLADVMASADYEVINNLLIPEYAKFNAQFAVNEMVLAYTKHSRFADKINNTNWPEILLYKGVKTGHSNPNLDPCGYRSIFTVKLAEKYYNIPDFYDRLMGYGESYKNGEENRAHIIVRPKETDLLALLEVNAIDYLFIYRSVASQHGLKFIDLPKEVSLKSLKLSKLYHSVSFKISGKKPGQFITKYGTPMVYGITVLEHGNSMPANKNGAVAFVNFILSEKGQKIMAANGQPPIIPPKITGNQSILK